MEIPTAPRGSGAHPVALTAIASRDLSKSRDFYARLFGWKMMPLSAEVCAAVTPAEQAVALRTNHPEGFPGTVPFLFAPDVDEALAAAVASGAVVEKAKWKVPTVGEMARFTAPGGSVYGFVNARALKPTTPMPAPLGPGTKAPAGAISSLELYADDFARTAAFFGTFGWGTRETMPQYMTFDPGVGVAGIFQSHTPSLPAVAYMACADVAAKLAEIEAAGGNRMGDPMSMPEWGTFGYFTDPTGTTAGLIGPA